KSRKSWTGLPLTLTIRSPGRRPARSPSESGSTAVTTTPPGFLGVLMGYKVSNNSVYISEEVYQIEGVKMNNSGLGGPSPQRRRDRGATPQRRLSEPPYASLS